MVAGMKVSTVLTSFGLKTWLFASPNNYQVLVNVLEFCNSQIQYQWTSAANIIFALLSKADILARIEHFTASEGPELPAGVGWKPTEGWFTRIRSLLPLAPLLVTFDQLIPPLEAHCKERQSKDESDALAFIKETTLVGLLPVPHPVQAVDYQPSAAVDAAVLWSFWVTVWEKHSSLFDEQAVQMFAAQDTE
jgi:hypothetical protein